MNDPLPTPPPTRIGIVEDDPHLAEDLRSMLEEAGRGILCVGIAKSAEQALEEFPALAPDLVFLDINLPGMGGVECAGHLSALLPELQIVMITVFDDTEVVFKALSAGAIGYLIKPVTSERLQQAIQEVRDGGAPMSSAIARRIVHTFRETPATAQSEVSSNLSTREKEILELLAKGYLMKEIAEEIKIAHDTLRTHTTRIYKKLHVHSRSQAVAKFLGKIH
jgi:DNA-binding NarL/FixJ family response regulator